MLTYGDMVDWSRLSDLVSNRVGMVNQLLGCHYAHSLDNPMVVRRVEKSYEILFKENCIAAYGVWDLDGIRAAYEVVNRWSDCVWHLARDGRLQTA